MRPRMRTEYAANGGIMAESEAALQPMMRPRQAGQSDIE